MKSDFELRQSIREAIVTRLEELKDEAVHWLNELQKLDHPERSPVDSGEAQQIRLAR